MMTTTSNSEVQVGPITYDELVRLAAYVQRRTMLWDWPIDAIISYLYLRLHKVVIPPQFLESPKAKWGYLCTRALRGAYRAYLREHCGARFSRKDGKIVCLIREYPCDLSDSISNARDSNNSQDKESWRPAPRQRSTFRDTALLDDGLLPEEEILAREKVAKASDVLSSLSPGVAQLVGDLCRPREITASVRVKAGLASRGSSSSQVGRARRAAQAQARTMFSGTEYEPNEKDQAQYNPSLNRNARRRPARLHGDGPKRPNRWYKSSN